MEGFRGRGGLEKDQSEAELEEKSEYRVWLVSSPLGDQ